MSLRQRIVLPMFAPVLAMPLPEFAAFALVLGLPAAIAVLFWPMLRPNDQPKDRSKAAASPPASTPLGLHGQWTKLALVLEASNARRKASLVLHQQASTHLGALDFEIDRLWRETRALGRALDAEFQTSAPFTSNRSRRRLAPILSRAAREPFYSGSFKLAS